MPFILFSVSGIRRVGYNSALRRAADIHALANRIYSPKSFAQYSAVRVISIGALPPGAAATAQLTLTGADVSLSGSVTV